MKILKIEKIHETCSDFELQAYDIFFDKDIDEYFIKRLEIFGRLLYLKSLKKPFFKVENDYCFIKGTSGDNKIRLKTKGQNEKYLKFIIKNIIKN